MPRAVVAFFLLLPGAGGAGEKIPWARDQAAAFAQAAERRGPILILFSSPECGAKAGVGGGRSRNKLDFQDRCELLEADVLSQPDVVAATARFVALQPEEGVLTRARIEAREESLNRRYHVATLPTVLFADPWGNEIVRLVGRIPKDGFLRVATAIPADFAPLEAAGRKLHEDPDNLQSLLASATFYQERGLLPVSERLYQTALRTPTLAADTAARRQVVIARGTNLLRMDKAAEAAKLFEKTLAEAPEGPASDALCFGWMMAELHAGRANQARAALAELEKRFPTSPYAAKARQNFEAAGAARR